jgi:EmrB/QacA subfamily drug resistance transporter
VLIATIVASSLAFIDGTVVTLALPQIQRQFHASASDVAWIVELYTLVVGSLILLGGALGDRYGRRRIFSLGTTLFALGSIGCAFASSIPTMLAARVFQGIGGMLVVPGSLAIIGAHFTGESRNRAIAAWSAFGALTGTLGPMLGGVLIDTVGWRWVFWINVPLAALVLYACAFHISESRDELAPKKLDVIGAALVTLGLGALTYALIASAQLRLNNPVLLGAAIGSVVFLVGFVLYESRARNPLVPASLFASRTFGSINLSTLLLYGALGGIFYEMPFAMIQGHGYRAIQTAFATLPGILGVALLARVGTSLARRFGTRIVLTIGPAIVCCGFALIAILERNANYVESFLPGVILFGLGMGITVAPLTAGVIDAAGKANVGIASGINNAVARVAGLITIAALTAVLVAAYNHRFDRDISTIRTTPAQSAAIAQQRDRLGGARYADPALQKASFDAFHAGFSTIAFTCAALALLAAIVNFAGVDDRELRSEV